MCPLSKKKNLYSSFLMHIFQELNEKKGKNRRRKDLERSHFPGFILSPAVPVCQSAPARMDVRTAIFCPSEEISTAP